MQTGPAFSPAPLLGKHCAMILAQKVRLCRKAGFQGEVDGTKGERVRAAGCLKKGLMKLAQCSTKNTALREMGSGF